MTIQELLEEVKPLIKDEVLEDETKWSSISEGVQSVVNDSVKSVIKNKDEILAEKKTLQERHKALEEQLENVKPFIENEVSFDEYERIRTEMEEIRDKQEQQPDVAKLKNEYFEQGKRTATQELTPKLSDLEKQLKQYESDQQKMQEQYRETLKKNELNRTLQELGVKADSFWIDGFYAKADAEYIETENRVAITLPHPSDPSIGRLPLADWARIFPQTEQGQRMIVAPQTTGAGARGSDGQGGKHINLQQHIDGMFSK